jgi:BolA family transcriptional regulator, general stress-responsive regulator
MNVVATLRQQLAVLEPTQIDIEDESHKHAGHAGAREGGHFRLLIVAPRFAGLSTMQRHRLVYDAVGDLKAAGIHALSIQAKTPAEL